MTLGVYLYCLGGPEHPAPAAVAGVDGAPVRSRPVPGFSAWVSELEHAPSASLERIRAHNAVVEAASRDATPLPLRFGQWFATDAALEASLRERGASLEDALRRVAGAMEFGVRVVDPSLAPEELDRASGIAYMEALARREHRAEEGRRRGRAVAEALRDWLGALVRDERVRPLGRDGLVAIAHLVGRHDTRSYQRRVGDFPARHPELRFVLSGPWPPYGFVE